MGRYEWIILEVGFVGLLVWELIRVRRAIRRAREDDVQRQAEKPPPPLNAAYRVPDNLE